MLPVVSAENIYSWKQSLHEETQDKISERFWDDLSQTNPILMDYILGYTEALRLEDSRCFFLDGIFTALSLIQRQIESDLLEKQYEV